MKETCTLRITEPHLAKLHEHLFPGDRDEHGAALLAGVSTHNGRVSLAVREVHLAREGSDYVKGKIGHRALTPQFIHRMITRARDERLAYLAVHNHGIAPRVDFSGIDLRSHETGYPALLQIARGMPVGALVSGKDSLQADVWMPDRRRLALEHAVVVGSSIRYLRPRDTPESLARGAYDRQVRMFGAIGQDRLARCRVAVIGLGGVGSIVVEYLARLGVGKFLLVDNDRVEESNLSRLVGATAKDALRGVLKVDVARRIIAEANAEAEVVVIDGDAATDSVAKKLTDCDYIFLAADSMRARLVANAIVHQYLIPGVQVGSKIRAGEKGELLEVMSANRPLRPIPGCLWCNQLIDSNLLAIESKSDAERRDQAYGVEEPSPSVVSLNAVGASAAVNDFLLDYLNLRPSTPNIFYQHYFHLQRRLTLVKPRVDDNCSECSYEGLRFGRGDSVSLPCAIG